MSRRLALGLLLVLGGANAAAARPFTFDEMARLGRLGDFDVSKDGKWVVYGVGRPDLAENKIPAALWLVPSDGSAAPRQLTDGTKKDRSPCFSPDGKKIAFISDREGSPQLWLLDLAGGPARRLTAAPEGFDGPLWSPDGSFLVAATEVPAECTDLGCATRAHERAERSKVKARLAERLLYRHWDSWRDGRRSHLYRVDVKGGAAVDLTPGNFDTPPFSLGGARDYDLSPDGGRLVYASNHDPVEATSTNGDIWELDLKSGERRCLSCDNRAYDGNPRYSPDGKRIAWRAQSVPGAESDKFDLVVYEGKGPGRRLTRGFDNWVEEFHWLADGGHLVFTSVVAGRKPIYQIAVDGGAATLLLDAVTASDPTPLGAGPALLFARSSFTSAPELVRLDGKSTKPLTTLNDYGGLELGQVTERKVGLADGRKLQAWVVTPPGFDPAKKYPALFWVHGGPQGAFEDSWSWRWNPQVLATAGYVVYLPNPRGSTGYGQPFVDAVSRGWGGKVYDDLMRGVDDLASLPYVDASRLGAAGASYGGFMMNWFEGHTRRFRALFCHAGIANQLGQYASEELWFPEHEFGGPPWKSKEYEKWNPIASAEKFATPMLVVHGERDYRVLVEQAYLMFTALQRRGVPSKLLVFPDENHWVLKPANSRLWYASMVDWFHRWLGGAPADAAALETVYSRTQ